MDFLLSRTISHRKSAFAFRFSRPVRAIVGIAVLAASVAAISGCNRAHKADVLATVNGKPIMKSQVELLYEANVGKQPEKPTKVQGDIVRLNILSRLINEEILMQRAAKMNLVASNEDVESRLNEIKAPFTPDEFQKQLEQQHLTLDALKQQIRNQLTEQKLFNKEINSKIDVTDNQITAYYNAHKAEFNLPQPQFHLAQILVTNIPENAKNSGNLQNSKAMNDAEAKRKIQMLDDRLKNGDDFGTLASNFSENPQNSSNGGDMGFISQQELQSDPEIWDAVSKLSPGEITPVLPVYATQDHKKVIGYAIYKLLDKEGAGQLELSDPRVQQSIRQRLHESRSQLMQNAYLEMLRDQAHVVNYYAESIFKNGPQ
jgi:peptidyl-prolyl cis-trans isomerase SurA